jgi:tetratricopeptide (TPR) repeat protein
MATSHATTDPLTALVSMGGRGSPCALGFAQREAGHDHETLFRWADQSEQNLLDALRADLDGVGDRTQVIVGPRGDSDEWWARDPRYGFTIRCFTRMQDVPLSVETPRMRRRIAFLRDDFLRHLATAHPVCAYHAAGPLSSDDLARALSQELRRLGARGLLYTRPAGPTLPHGTLLDADDGLWIAGLQQNAGVDDWRDLAASVGAWTDPIPAPEPAANAVPQSGANWLHRIDEALRDGRDQDARDHAGAALAAGVESNPATPLFGAHGYARLAELFKRLGDAAGAEAALRRAIMVDPGSARMHDLLARALIDAQRWDEAANVKLQADALEPGSIVRMAALADLLIRVDRLDDAETVLLKARKMAPRDAGVARVLSTLRLRQGRGEAALSLRQAATDRQPNIAHHHARLANGLMQAGKLAEAEAAQRRAVELDGTNAAYQTGLSVLLHRQNKLSAALEVARGAAELPGADARAFGQLGRLAALAGHWEEAARALGQAAASDSRWQGRADQIRARLERG